ncbi:MAG TPA: Gfo/Idh/MocA family oxidoreductase [Nitrolancea sp.]|jgi:predicted dehydrogenase|nr:Gfo/Idh/MocA family oxidoreductase [Nitrolancea sp.]
MRRLRVGLIGAGTIANSAHLPAIARLHEELELVAIADVRPEMAELAAKEYGAEAWYSDYRELLARKDIDFVDICTPEFLHAEQVAAAADAGKHIHCEKPMSSTVAEADSMIEAARRNGVKLMIGHSRRFTPRYQQIRASIERGEIGEVRLVRENERRAMSMYNVMNRWSGYWTPEGNLPWIASAQFTLGAAMTNAVHETDLARWFAGQDGASVYAESRITNPEGQVPDMITYTITFKNGSIGAAEVVNQLPPRFPYFHMMEVYGTEGTIRATDPPMSPYEAWTTEGMRFPSNFAVLIHVGSAYVRELQQFAAAVRDDTPVPLDAWEARQAIALSAAAVESSQTGRTVAIPAANRPGGVQ